MLTPEVLALFEPADGQILFLAVGNPLRSDDGVGPWIAARARPRPGYAAVIDAGESPEDRLEEAVALRPARVVILDAADFGGEPGEAAVIPQEALMAKSLSTHRLPLLLAARVLAEDAGSVVYFLGVQPAAVSFGEGLTPTVEATAGGIVELINRGGSPG